MKHKWTGERCLVAHFNADGELLPSCKKCKYCGYVKYPYDQPCVGTQPQQKRKRKHIHQQTNGGAKPKLKMCEACGVHPADLPSKKCCGCNSYSEHF